MMNNQHHITSIKTYITIFAALLILLVLTVAVAFFDFGVLGLPIALAIATTKASLIMAYFMHLRHSSKLVIAFSLIGFIFLIIMLVIAMADYVARGGIP